MTYGEALPAQCPPEDAVDQALSPVYRLVPDGSPGESCFASHNAQGKVKPSAVKSTDCQWASCSLNRKVDALLKIKGLRKRNRFVAELSIPAGSGVSLEDTASGHIDFWRYDHFDVSTAVNDVWEHGLS